MVLYVPNLRRAVFPRGYNSSGVGSGSGGGGGTGPSGVAMPTTAPSGWVPRYRQDFDTDCNYGAFLATYDGTYNATQALTDGRVGAYPTTYYDTRSKSSSVDGKFGVYDPGVIKCVGGVMVMHISYDPTLTARGVTGLMRVCCPLPRLSAVGWGETASSRRSVRCRYVPGPGVRTTTKVAWLGWPHNNHSTTLATAGIPDSSSSTGFRGGDGEIDWPEQDAGSIAQWFMHKQNATSTDTGSAKQTSGNSTVNFYDGAWHTWTWTRIVGSYSGGWVGQSLIFEVDGVQVGATQTSAVPMTDMRWALQTETTLSSSTPLRTDVDFTIEVDWVTEDGPA